MKTFKLAWAACSSAFSLPPPYILFPDNREHPRRASGPSPSSAALTHMHFIVLRLCNCADLIDEGYISSSDPCWYRTRYFLLCVCVRGQLAANCLEPVWKTQDWIMAVFMAVVYSFKAVWSYACLHGHAIHWKPHNVRYCPEMHKGLKVFQSFTPLLFDLVCKPLCELFLLNMVYGRSSNSSSSSNCYHYYCYSYSIPYLLIVRLLLLVLQTDSIYYTMHSTIVIVEKKIKWR